MDTVDSTPRTMKVIPGLILMSSTVVVEKLIKYTLPFFGSRLFLLF